MIKSTALFGAVPQSGNKNIFQVLNQLGVLDTVHVYNTLRYE